jgi:guanine nucleotide-binding protein G(i) subunit alpha
MDSAQAIVLAMRKFDMDPVEPVNRVCLFPPPLMNLGAHFLTQGHADKILDYRLDLDASPGMPTEMVQAVDSLWHDPIIPSILDRSSEFYLMDSAP